MAKIAKPDFLHPRAVRMGLERVIEHQRVALTESPLLAQVYEQVLQPPSSIAPINEQQLADFLSRENKAEREDWVQRFLQGRS